jgi:hypothetical protein
VDGEPGIGVGHEDLISGAGQVSSAPGVWRRGETRRVGDVYWSPAAQTRALMMRPFGAGRCAVDCGRRPERSLLPRDTTIR